MWLYTVVNSSTKVPSCDVSSWLIRSDQHHRNLLFRIAKRQTVLRKDLLPGFQRARIRNQCRKLPMIGWIVLTCDVLSWLIRSDQHHRNLLCRIANSQTVLRKNVLPGFQRDRIRNQCRKLPMIGLCFLRYFKLVDSERPTSSKPTLSDRQ
jgi:hypothetical protein